MTRTRIFEGMAPSCRFAVLRDRYSEIRERLAAMSPPFSVIISGSTVYGYNERFHGNLDDLDCHVVIPDWMEYGDLADGLIQSHGGRAWLTTIQIPPKQMFAAFAEGMFHILRIAASLRDVEVGLHVIRLSQFVRSGVTVGHCMPMLLRNAQRYHADTYWQSAVGFPLFVDPGIEWAPCAVDPEFMVLDDFVFRYGEHSLRAACWKKAAEVEAEVASASHRARDQEATLRRLLAQEDKVVLKGVLGDRLLMGEVVAEAAVAPVSPTLRAIWFSFVARALAQNPEATDEDLLWSFARACRFSGRFREFLIDKIARSRAGARSA